MFGIGTVSQTAIDPNYVFTVDTSITESGNTTSDTEFKFLDLEDVRARARKK